MFFNKFFYNFFEEQKLKSTHLKSDPKAKSVPHKAYFDQLFKERSLTFLCKRKYLNESFFQSLDFELVFLRRFQSNFPQNKILAAKWLKKHERLNRRKKRNDNKFDFCSFLVVKIAITARD